MTSIDKLGIPLHPLPSPSKITTKSLKVLANTKLHATVPFIDGQSAVPKGVQLSTHSLSAHTLADRLAASRLAAIDLLDAVLAAARAAFQNALSADSDKPPDPAILREARLTAATVLRHTAAPPLAHPVSRPQVARLSRAVSDPPDAPTAAPALHLTPETSPPLPAPAPSLPSPSVVIPPLLWAESPVSRLLTATGRAQPHVEPADTIHAAPTPPARSPPFPQSPMRCTSPPAPAPTPSPPAPPPWPDLLPDDAAPWLRSPSAA